jgi:hypothetical protein
MAGARAACPLAPRAGPDARAASALSGRAQYDARGRGDVLDAQVDDWTAAGQMGANLSAGGSGRAWTGSLVCAEVLAEVLGFYTAPLDRLGLLHLIACERLPI